MLNVFIFVVIALAIANGQHICPVCTNSNDYKSCTGTRECHYTHEICMVRIDTQLNNRIEYFCTNYDVCQIYAAVGCDPSHGQTCYYCCTDVVSCRGQREALFMGILAG
ncbi:collagen alpha-1(XII) chain [Biomphalaria pfeifferi]|uniref:Collagen alpha-1(XII) chain n=1 Tax=Biomphalaria pfeifferi TaxID=112525 RepID=A0AAD8EVY3_BIOPF|nr:collagen alpha-1(XII) chain [Biomphalaria pfeifferi]